MMRVLCDIRTKLITIEPSMLIHKPMYFLKEDPETFKSLRPSYFWILRIGSFLVAQTQVTGFDNPRGHALHDV
jgi:hypothetical protein